MDYSSLTREDVFKAIKNKTVYFNALKDHFKDDKEIILACIHTHGYSLSLVSKRLQDDEEVVLESVKERGLDLFYASDRLKDNDEIVLKAVMRYGYSLKYASERLKNNKEFLLEPIKNNIMILCWASNKLQNDKNLLELIEGQDVSMLSEDSKYWYEQRIEALASIREKELMEKSISVNSIKPKKIKF